MRKTLFLLLVKMLQSLGLFSPFNVGISQNSALDPNIIGNIVGYTMVYYIQLRNMTSVCYQMFQV